MIRLVRIGRDRLLVLRLASSLEIGIGEIQTVLIDLDVRRLVGRAGVAAARGVADCRAAPAGARAVVLGAQFKCGESGEQASLDIVHLVIDTGHVRLDRVADRRLKQKDARETERRK